MRNADEIAKRIAKAVMDRIESDRGIHLSSIEDEVMKHLALALRDREGNWPPPISVSTWRKAFADLEDASLRKRDPFQFTRQFLEAYEKNKHKLPSVPGDLPQTDD